MPDSGFEGLVIQNFDHLTSDIKTIRISQELMQLDLTAIKVEQARVTKKQEELAGPLKSWSLEDSIALKKVIDREKQQDSAADLRDEQAAQNTKRIQGWRDRLLLVTAALAVFVNIKDGLVHIWHNVIH